jgi:integrase
MIKYVFKPKRKVQGRRKIARLYSGRYKLDGEVRLTEVPLKTSDKQVAEKKLDELVKDRERERAGIAIPRILRDANQRPTAEHLADYLGNLSTLGRDDDYIKKLGYRINILIRECGWKNPAAITGDSFEKWRRKQEKAPKTLNEYLDSANAMFNWMTGKCRIAQNPLVTVEKVQFEPVRIRRAFEDDELERLLKVAGESRIGYLAAVHTRLRRAELKAVLWENIDLDGNVPALRLEGKFTKNKKYVHIPLHPEIAAELRALKPADAKPSDPVFIGKMVPPMCKMKADLKKAGVEFLKNGRRADFHSLRHTLGTNLARRNVAPRVAMEIMRHSDIRLTMNHYTDRSQLPVAEAIATLPTFGAAQPYTDPQIHPQNQGILSNEQSRSGTVSLENEASKIIHPERFCHNLALTDVVEHGGGIGSSGRIRSSPRP